MRKAEVTTEVFEITDYTNSTDFEEFIYSVEQVIERWGLSKGAVWNRECLPEFSRTESLAYGRQSFRLTHSILNVADDFKPLQQADFPSKTHCLNRWYGLSEFIILSPETTEDAIYYLDSSKLLMSSLASALTRTQCSLPMFIQLGSPSKRFYSGIWLNKSIQTTLDMVLLKCPPPQCSSLKEILCFYKRSIPCAVSPFPQTFISVRYTFCLHNFVGCLSDDHVYPQNASKSKLPFGAVRDPIQDILLATTWTGLSEHLISDSESGELDPLRATQWSIRHTNTSNSFCVLYNFVDYVFSLLSDESTIISLLGTSVDDNIEVDVSAAFRSLTAPKPIVQVASFDITTLPGKLLGTYGTFVEKEVIASYMHYIFEEAYSEEVVQESRSSNIKSCPRDSITHRITLSLCLVLCTQGGVKGFAQLWRCIVEQLRFHYEKSKTIPGASCKPDPAFSLLHQKIQMLNACINQKIERESALYACNDTAPQHESVHDTLTLLLTGEKLRVPRTQRHAPMTEDMQEEHTEALAKLGSSAEGSRLRAELHSLSLLSDMQAFKAANPDCRLEDFIRWYSPRDWITVPITRPLIPDNTLPDLVEAVEKSAEEEECSVTMTTTDCDNSDEAFDDLYPAGDSEKEKAELDPAGESEKEKAELDSAGDSEKAGNVEKSEAAGEGEELMEESVEGEESTREEAEEGAEEVGEGADEASPLEVGDGVEVGESAGEVGESREEMEEKMDCSDACVEEVISPDIVDVEIDDSEDAESPDKANEELGVEDSGLGSTAVRTSVVEDSDDEFVDAEESHDTMETGWESHDTMETCDKSEQAFLSASDNSDRNLSISPDTAAGSNDCIEESNVNSEQDTMDGRDNEVPLETEQESEQGTVQDTEQDTSAIRYEQPLDPGVYGGHLSARMSKESVWKDVWYYAKPIPIWQQKRLFDDTKEAERILHYFIQSEMRTIARLVMPTLLHAAHDRIQECPDSEVNFIKAHVTQLHKKLTELQHYSSEDTDIYQEILSDISNCELIMSKYHSVKNKFTQNTVSTQQTGDSGRKMTELERRTRRNVRNTKLTTNTATSKPAVPEQSVFNEDVLIEQLLTAEAEIAGAARSPWGSVIQRLFHAQQVASSSSHAQHATPASHAQHATPSSNTRQVPIFPLPVGREYILQTLTKHPSPVSRDCKQRMFVTVSGSEFRMAYANSSDKTFL